RGRCRRRARELRHKHNRWISPGRRLHWPDYQGREAGQPAGLAAHESGAGHQSQDRQGARLDDPASAARPRPRGDRMMGWMAPLRHLSAKLLSDRNSSEWESSMGEVTTIGLDLAKHVFQV